MVVPNARKGSASKTLSKFVKGQVSKEVISDIEKRVAEALNPFKGKRK